MLDLFLENLSSIAFIQDHNHRFCANNNAAAYAFGFKNRDEMIGRTSYDFKCQAADRAEQFIALDKQVLQKKEKLNSIIIDDLKDGMQIHLVEKSLITLPNNKNGVFVQGTSLVNYQHFMSLANQIFHESKNFNLEGIYRIKNTNFQFSLSEKESECLFFLIRGIAIKEISRKLNRSVRTIEGYVNNIKYKMNCYTKNQLIEKAISSGMLATIPRSLLKTPSIITLPSS